MTALVRHRPRVRPSANWLIVPPLLFIGLFLFIPLGVMVLESLKAGDGTATGALSLEHYREVIQSVADRRALWNSFLVAGVSTAITACLGAVLLITLAQCGSWMRRLILVSLFVPFMAHEIVRIVSWMVVLSPDGPVSSLLQALGIASGPVQLVKNWTGVLVGMVHVELPFFVLTAYPVIARATGDLGRAARGMGALPAQALFSVHLPLVAPAVMASLLITFVLGLGYYATPVALGGSGQVTLSIVIVDTVNALGDWAAAGAVAVVLVLITAVVLMAVARLGGLRAIYDGAGRPIHRREARRDLWQRLSMSVVVRRPAELVDRAPALGRGLAALRLLATTGLLAYLWIPVAIVLPASLSASDVLGLPDGLSLRWYQAFLGDQAWREATLTSLVVAALAAAGATALAAVAGVALIRGSLRWRSGILTVLLLPLIMPTVVTALGLLLFFNEIGLSYSIAGIVIGHLVLCIPYALLVMTAAMQGFPWEVDVAAQACGANVSQRVRHLLVPLLRPALVTAFLFSFVVSFSEISFAYLMQSPDLTTLPVRMLGEMKNVQTPVTAAASGLIVLVVASGSLVLAARNLWKRGHGLRRALDEI